MDKPQHIAILCSRLDLPGGIERAVVNTANLFAAKGHPITLIILDETDKRFYDVDPSVKIIQQPLSFGITQEGNILTRKIKMLSDVLQLRKIFKKINADVVISSEYPFSIAAVLCRIKKKSKLISWEHHHFNWIKKNKFWTKLFELAYPRIDVIVCLNKEEAEYFKKFTSVEVIPNFAENKPGRTSSLDSRMILSAGWLIPRKGIDIMMTVAKTILKKNPQWKWKLIGDGEMKEEVIKFISEEKLEEQFILQAPVHSNIEDEYVNASVFVLASRYEAFPMVLLEAMSFGVPCVSFDCPTGPADIIQNNKTGLLVEKENAEKLSEAILSLVNEDSKRKKLGENALEAVKQFSPEKIYSKWEQLF